MLPLSELLAVYVLAGYNRANIFSSEAALKYFLIGAFASGFLLYGIALVYGVTGTQTLPAEPLTISGAGYLNDNTGALRVLTGALFNAGNLTVGLNNTVINVETGAAYTSAGVPT